MHRFQKYFIVAALLLTLSVVFFGTGSAAAVGSGLSRVQADAILELLKHFGAGSSVVERVSRALLRAPDASSCRTFSLSRALSVGARDKTAGEEVSELQRALKDTGDFTYPEITGYFGPVTREALARFQAREHIATSSRGVLGTTTRSLLRERCSERGGIEHNATNSPQNAVSASYPACHIRPAEGSEVFVSDAYAQNEVTCLSFCNTNYPRAAAKAGDDALVQCVFSGKRLRTFGGNGTPDLAVESELFPREVWNSFRSAFWHAELRVANRGGSDLSERAVTGILTVTAPEGYTVHTSRFGVDIPEPGETNFDVVSIPANKLSSVRYTVEVHIDADERIAEINEVNNYATDSFRVEYEDDE